MKRKGFLLTLCIILFLAIGLYAAIEGKGDRLRTPDYYDVSVRALFKKDLWEAGKKLLDEGLERYPYVSNLNELNGRYYYHYGQYDNARFYLVRAVKDNDENVTAKQLLITVEDETGNYSSAICYVNELLEINPFWKGLWRKKVGLYRKQKNDVEADRLLKRLYQIYPNDTTVIKDYAYSLEESYIRQRKGNNKTAAIESLQELIKVSPQNENYYLDLTNLLLQQGNTVEALEIASRGASYIPSSTSLIIKKAGILAEEARYQEALAYVQQRMKYNKSPLLTRCYNGLLAEAAVAAQMNDPYVLYGKMYERQKSDEALDYMLNTSITRGYNEDALYYLSEAQKKRGSDPSLLYKAYIVYKRMGNQNKAYSLLNDLYNMDPSNTDIADELSISRLTQANSLMSDEFYAEALPYLKSAARQANNKEIKVAAWNKIYTCCRELKRYNEALSVLDSIETTNPEMLDYPIKKADIYNLQGNTSEALTLLAEVGTDTTQREMRAAYIGAYEEIAIPYIKKLIDEGATPKAYNEACNLVKVNPSSQLGLLYTINMATSLGQYAEFDHYTSIARSIYPEDLTFIIKKSASYSHNKEYERAVDLLRPELNTYPGNQNLIGAFSENSEYLALQLLKKHQPQTALEVTDTALVFDPNNPSLLLTKGMAYEAMHLYDSAYVYQKLYKPGLGEVQSHKRHLEGLQSRSYKNEIDIEYLQSRYAEADILTSVASISYTRKLKNDAITERINYAGRDGSTAGNDLEEQVPGGVGIQVQAEWEHRFSTRWSAMANLALANKYFPQVVANVQISHTFRNDITAELHASYRRIETYKKSFRWEEDNYEPEAGYSGWVFDHWDKDRHNLFNIGAGISKDWEYISLGGKVNGFLLNSKLYANASAQLKFFPLNDGRTSITVLGGLGTAPEASMIDNAMPNSFDHLNTTVGLGGTYMLNKHISIGIMGTWNTYYNQMNQRTGDFSNFTEYLETKYRNLYNIYGQVYIYF